MSYSVCSAHATCTVKDLASTEDVAISIYDFLVNHPDEIPCGLDDYDSDEVVEKIESYISIDQNTLTISYSSESDTGNHDSEIFDFLAHHFALLQSSYYMEVVWITDNSKTGYSAGTCYYDRQGEEIDIHKLLLSHFS